MLWSFDRAAVTVADHHAESERFLLLLAAMTRKGVAVPTDWSWIVAPMSGSTLPTFHRVYDDFPVTPNFFAQPTDFAHLISRNSVVAASAASRGSSARVTR